MTYASLAVGKKDENRLQVAEMRMLRRIKGNTRKEQVSNQIIQEDANVCQMSTFLRQKRVRTYQEKRRRQRIKKYDGYVHTEEEKKWAA